ncbi:putative dolichyl pyrophosphate phosphatase [Leptomonas pyrrhocoris]|uniref:Putative dolichyl pyrophosphate phosphatase n=1 Tax=Leptomonas pyrrhocoris TaxID=157538 RepID=A0A0M9G657_LEPPY|nr:putative dolichyl pyrophosphate phosphatase [Leptomonas pyrrhocoris]KPA83016.1 putative dolichyl pyrophosphate phosphatase [Leptomonas pyrrhocoris]|eukprot:XP_015661455.1 putative dolichyl pyrophosphate phosphatase [Leptomonas pyrrhocoris]
MDLLVQVWSYTHLSAVELQQGVALASSRHANSFDYPNWKSWALTEVLYRDHDVLSKAFAVASFLPLVIVMFLAGLASAPCRERRLPALNLILFLVLSVGLNLTCKECIRSQRPAHPAAGMNYTTIHGMPSDHSQFMAGLAVYLMQRWKACNRSPSSASVTVPQARRKQNPSKKAATHSLVGPHGTQRPLPRLLFAFLISAAFFVGAGRVYNGYHTIGQVVAGWVVGAALALLCTTAAAQRGLTWTSETVMLPVMLVCTYWTNAVC